MQYFVGEFDGMRIKNESSSGKIYRPDYGPDYYAAITYNNTLPAIGPVSIGWVNNWNYANEIPAGKWRGAMSLPRSIAVKKVGNEWILVQQPVDQLNALIGSAKSFLTSTPIPLPSASFDLQWDWADGGNAQAAEMVLGNQELVIRYDPKTREVELNRSGGSKGFTNEAFQKLGVFKQVVPGAARGQLHFRLLFDQSIAELYVGDGELVMTAQIFPDALESVRFTNTPEPVKLAEVGAYRR
jgi:fructan beta-fructosidase